MKNKKSNIVVLALIVVIVAITAVVIGWMLAKHTQVPVLSQPASITSGGGIGHRRCLEPV
jgi:flagellar basal body-associated protein FliL